MNKKTIIKKLKEEIRILKDPKLTIDIGDTVYEIQMIFNNIEKIEVRNMSIHNHEVCINDIWGTLNNRIFANRKDAKAKFKELKIKENTDLIKRTKIEIKKLPTKYKEKLLKNTIQMNRAIKKYEQEIKKLK